MHHHQRLGPDAFATPIAEFEEHARTAEADGSDGYWVNQLSGTDTMTVLALLGRVTETMELGTAVIPTWGHAPDTLAGQALTAQAASGDRIALGIGLAHKPGVEAMPRALPAAVRHMTEYLDCSCHCSTSARSTSSVTSGRAPPSSWCPPPRPRSRGCARPQMLDLVNCRQHHPLAGRPQTWTNIAPTITAAAEAAGGPPGHQPARVRHRRRRGRAYSGHDPRQLQRPPELRHARPQKAPGPCRRGHHRQRGEV
jgi:alkanesulfonate monooxygenase SsuD/methylene tetrahydromethanopterin reductase-like flavin-dependent oxidoreductase (luciferase family)